MRRRLLLLTLGALFFCTGLSFAQPVFTIQNKKDACDGLPNGSFEVLVSVGNPPPLRVFIFGPPDDGPLNATVGVPLLISGLPGGPAPGGKSYIVVVQDADGSSVQFVSIVNTAAALTAVVGSSSNNTSCTVPDGFIDLDVSGGSGAGYSYSWTGPNGFTSTNQDISGVPGGSYTVLVSDNGTNCTRTVGPIVLTDPSPAIQNITTTSPQSVCTGNGFNIDMAGSESGVTYEVIQNNSVNTGITQIGAGGPLQFTVPAGTFANGDNFKIRATNNFCTPTDMNGVVIANIVPLPTATASGGGTVCFGGTLPNVTFTFTGAAPFSFTYTDGTTPVIVNNHPTTTFTINNAPAGTYSVSALTDNNGCVGTNFGASASVIVNPLPTAVVSGGGSACSGSPLPTVTFTFTGTAPFTFSYTDGSTPSTVNNHPNPTFSISNAPAGTYSVTALSDANGCVATSLGASVNVIVNPLPTVSSVTGGGTICSGGTLPDVSFNFTGAAPFTFTYTDGITPVTINNHPTPSYSIINAPAGAYSVTALADANGCNATALGGNVNVIVNPLPTATISGGGSVCASSPLPTITFTFTGTAPYNFTYTDGTTPVAINNHATNTFSINNAAAGNYSVTALSDANGCVGTDLGTPVSVVVNPLPTVSGVTGGGTVCSGAPLPDVTINFTGTAPFTFTYTDGSTPVTINNHPSDSYVINNATAGDYSVTALTDANGCNATALGNTVAVAENPLPTATISGGGTVCSGDALPNVTFTFTGTAPFTFTYTDGVNPGTTINNHPTNIYTISNAPAGLYSVTALSDGNSCIGTSFGTAVSVVENPRPTVSSVTGGGTVCSGATLPDVTFNFTGTAPFNFTYFNGTASTIVNNHPSASFTIDNAPAGIYSITALSDANGCAATTLGGDVSVIVNPLPTATVNGGGTTCSGGSLPDVTFTFTGQAPYTFTYTDGINPVTINNHATNSYTINNAPEGTYSVTALSDANSCVGTNLGSSVAVVENTLPTVSGAIGGGTVCSGETLPDVTFNFTGTAPFTFTYTDGLATTTITNHPSPTFTIVTASAGNYEITSLTDNNGCSATTLGSTVSVVVNPLPTASVAGGGVVCEGATLPNVTFNFTGTAPFTFTYTDGVTPVTIADHPSNSYPINNAPAGTYSITALTDVNTCVGTSLGSPVDVIVNAIPTVANVAGGGTVCAGDPLPSVTFEFTGTAPFTFTYTDGTTPTTVTAHPSSTYSIASATAGNYTITSLTDANGCNATSVDGNVIVVVNPLPTATTSGGGSVCAGGTLPDITFTFTGTAPFTFTYTDGVTPVTVNNHPGTTFLISNAPAGSYSVTALTDATGCNATSLGTSVTVSENTPPDATFSGLTSPTCTNSTAMTLTAVTAGGAFSGDGISGNTFTPSVAGAGTFTITYTVSVSGCSAFSTQDVTVNAAPDATITGQPPVCSNAAPITLTSATPGGTWSGPGVDPVTGIFTPSTAGPGVKTISYQVTTNGCSSNDTEDITVLNGPDATITPAGPFCISDAPTNLTVASNGGLWSGTGITDPVLGTFDPSIGAGTYNITYTVTTGSCTDSDDIDIDVMTAPDATITAVGPLCQSDAAITLTAATAGGVWSGTGVDASGVFAPAVAGPGTHTISYTVTFGGCSDTDDVDIIVNDSPDATVTPVGPFCITDGSVNLVVATVGGTWSGTGVDASGVFSPATAGVGSHVIMYSISNGTCTDTDQITIVVADPPDASISAAGPFCTNDVSVTLTATTSGGAWSGTGVDASGLFDPSAAGPGIHNITYTITIGGCSDSDSIDIVVNASPDASITPVGPFCISDAAVTLVTATAGGTWGGTGVDAGGLFDPAVAGVGTHSITYSVTSDGCTETDNIEIVVSDPPDATISGPASLCTGDDAVTLTAVTTGGTWSGTGVDAAGVFDPLAAGAGSHTITYTMTIGGCTDTDTHEIVVNQSPNAAITPVAPFCITDGAVTLVAATAGGTWSGTGVDASGVFDPATAGVGTHDITYSITSGSCADTDMISITVAAPPSATIMDSGPFCTADGNVTLISGTPGGTWSGPAVDPVTGVFDPLAAGAASHNITYTVTVGGCSDTDDVDIEVLESPDATITAVGPFCISSPAIDLTAATSGGTWSGTGITNASQGTFDPSAAGAGTHTISYTIATDDCTSTDTQTIIVKPASDPGCGGASACFVFNIIFDPVNSKNPSCSNQNDGVVVYDVSEDGYPGKFDVSLLQNNITLEFYVSNAGKFTFDNLAPGDYQLRVEDQLGNICLRDFEIKVETTVKATSSTVANSSCFDQPLGIAMLNVTGGNSPYDYSVDGGASWVSNYVSGNEISGMAVGSYNILVRDDDSDNCPAEVPIVIANDFEQITFNISASAVSSCNAADGKITVTNVTGGSGELQMRLNQITGLGNVVIDDFNEITDPKEYSDRSQGSYFVEVMDQVGCVVDNLNLPVTVTSPGAVEFTVTKIADADCINNGKSGVISIAFTIPGDYLIGIGKSQVTEPSNYVQYTYNDGDPAIFVDTLSRGSYFVFVKPTSGTVCASTRPTGEIEGAYAISFDVQRVCFAEIQPSINLINVVGQPNAQMTVEVYRLSSLSEKVDEFTVPTSETISVTYQGEPAGSPHTWLIQPDTYVIKAYQNQSFCPGEPTTPSYQVTYTATQPMTLAIDKIKQSLPEPRQTGGFTLATIIGGSPLSDEDGRPYFIVSVLDPSSNTPILNDMNVYRNAQGNYQHEFRNLPVGNYLVQVIDNNGCEATTIVIVPADTRILIPNIFTPNNDTVNDLFEVVNLPEGGNHKLVITNRWGKQIFSSGNYSEGNFWDAEGEPDGIYFYRLQVAGEQTYTGWVEVLRGDKP